MRPVPLHSGRGSRQRVDGRPSRPAGLHRKGGEGGRHETGLHQLGRARDDDDRLGREPARRADDGRLRPRRGLPVHRPGDPLPAADRARLRRAGERLDRRRLPVGQRRAVDAARAARDLVPVRDDDLLLPEPARLRREHVRVCDQPRPRVERRVHGGDHHRALLGRRLHLRARDRRDRQARLQRPRDRDADTGRDPRRARARLPLPGQQLLGADGRRAPAAGVDRDRQPRADRQQLPLLRGDGDERRPRRG